MSSCPGHSYKSAFAFDFGTTLAFHFYHRHLFRQHPSQPCGHLTVCDHLFILKLSSQLVSITC